jgi:tRNA-specific 2-thiouridylase
VRLRDINWLGDAPLATAAATGLDVAVRVRSTREPQPAVLRCDGDGVAVELVAGEFGVSPGQACVLYDGTGARARVLGGGTIVQPALASVTAGPAVSAGAPASARRAAVAES